MVYDDEDPEAARLAWFKGRAEQARAGGRWRYVEGRMRYRVIHSTRVVWERRMRW